MGSSSAAPHTVFEHLKRLRWIIFDIRPLQNRTGETLFNDSYGIGFGAS